MIRKLPILISILTFLLLIVNGFSSESPKNNSIKHFVLAHGAGHGAWCWYKIIAKLKSSGHNVTALDLAASGIDLTPFETVRSIADYHKPLMDFMANLSENAKVFLVAHSAGGFAISQAMEKFPNKISVAVFVTAAMPGPSLNSSTLNNMSLSQTPSLMDSHYEYGNGPKKPPTALIFGSRFLSSTVYQLSPIQDWALATTLVRRIPLFSNEDSAKEIILTKENYGSVHRVFIVAEKDKLGKKYYQEWMIKRNQPNEVIEIFGSDHMVMLSKPIQLSAHLLKIARNYD